MASKRQNWIFVDSSLFKALADDQDEFHDRALDFMSRLEAMESILITSNYILAETFTLLRKRLGKIAVDKFRKDISKSYNIFKIIRVTVSDEAKAWDWFLFDWSDLSFIDCVSFAMMKRFGLTKVATFDNHFKRAGFEIV